MKQSSMMRMAASISGIAMILSPLAVSAASPSTSSLASLQAQLTKATKAEQMLQAFHGDKCTFTISGTPTKRELTACKREVNLMSMKVRTALRALPSATLDGYSEFMKAVSDCRHGECSSVTTTANTLRSSVGTENTSGSFTARLKVKVDEATAANAIIDPVFKGQDATTPHAIIDPVFHPENTTSIIDPVFHPTTGTTGSTSIIDPVFHPTTDTTSTTSTTTTTGGTSSSTTTAH